MNNCEKIGDTVIIRLPSEVDDYVATGIVENTREVFSDKRVKYVIFDFEHTRMMDSSGIGLITRRFRDVYDRKGLVYIINESEQMKKILTMSGIYRIVNRAADIEEAYAKAHGSFVYQT